MNNIINGIKAIPFGMLSGIIVCIAIIAVTAMAKGSATKRVPNRDATNVRSFLNLMYNLATVGLLIFLTWTVCVLIHFPGLIITTFVVTGFCVWAWPRCWYNVSGNTVVLTQDFLRPTTTLDNPHAGDRQITCYNKYGPGFSIAAWSEDYQGTVQTELSDPLRLIYTISFNNDTGEARVTIRYKVDYRSLDQYAAQGPSEKSRRRNIEETLDDEIGSQVERTVSAQDVMHVIQNIGTFSANITHLFLGQQISPTESELGIEITKITFTVNMSTIKANALSARGATEESQLAVDKMMEMAKKHAPAILDEDGQPTGQFDTREGWRIVCEAITLHSTSAGTTKNVAITRIGGGSASAGDSILAGLALGGGNGNNNP